MHFDASQIDGRLSPTRAVEAIEAALRSGLRVGAGAPREIVDLAQGQFLLMPSEFGAFAGVKVVTVAPANPAIGRPRIQGSYLLFDAQTLTLVATLDGVALTNRRTAAVSIAAIRPLLKPPPLSLAVACFGWGPQGRAHIDALAAVVGGPVNTTWVVRNRGSAVLALGEDANVVLAGSHAAVRAVQHSDVIVCATSSVEPLFDGQLPRDGSVVIAIGSHTPEAREIDSALMRRALVVVEDRATALRESGDVILAIAEGALNADALVEMADTVTGRISLAADRPTVFKSSGMGWEDLVIAAAVVGSSGR
jgi:ornithine cyclodeaminase/alanine dehydrogenase-like protein (mu-crystallin family)